MGKKKPVQKAKTATTTPEDRMDALEARAQALTERVWTLEQKNARREASEARALKRLEAMSVEFKKENKEWEKGLAKRNKEWEKSQKALDKQMAESQRQLNPTA